MEDTKPDLKEDAPAAGGSFLDASNILVFHPGSRSLRLGRSCQAVPHTMLNVIARKRRRNVEKSLGKTFQEPFIKKTAPLDGTTFQSVEDCRLQLEHSLENTPQISTGKKRFRVPNKHLQGLNAKVNPVRGHPQAATEWHDSKDDVIVGDDVLYLDPSADYNVHFPFQNGDINLHSGIGGSQTSALVDIQTIFSYAIKHHLHIPLQDLSKYRAVLVIPALYQRPLIKHYFHILLTNMGFGGAFVLQDHVAATFGAGLGYACVVDVGDQKTSISCVEDGVSHPDTRIHLNYGGSDLTQVFYYLLRNVGFSYKECDPLTNRLDAELLHKLKEENCHLDLDQCGLLETNFLVKQPGRPVFQHTLYLGDDRIIAASSFFHTDLLAITGSRKSMKFMGKDPGDPEDPHDHIYLSETSRKYNKAGANDPSDINDSQAMDEDNLEIVADEPDRSSQAQSARRLRARDEDSPPNLLSLDAAILKSIDACPNEELKRKMYSCILLVGGGLKFKGADRYLQGKLATQVPFQYRSDPMEVITNAKDMSSTMTTWKGAAILACLETAQELWITPQEWKKQGQKLLREKAPFPWA